MTTLQLIILILAIIWAVFELFHFFLFITKKIKNKKYESSDGVNNK